LFVAAVNVVLDLFVRNRNLLRDFSKAVGKLNLFYKKKKKKQTHGETWVFQYDPYTKQKSLQWKN